MSRPVAGVTIEYTLWDGGGGGLARPVAGAILQRIFEVEGILVSIGFDKTRDITNLESRVLYSKKDDNIVANRATYNINFIFPPECSDVPEIWINAILTLLSC
jgi:hypothetical protein